jgi:hypothetical protein
MIKVITNNGLDEEVLVDIIYAIMGNPIEIHQDEDKNYDKNKPLSEKNPSLVLMRDSSTPIHLMINEDGEFLVEMADVAGNKHGLFFKRRPNLIKDNQSCMEIYFLEENSYSAILAKEFVNAVGGELVINKKVVHSKDLKDVHQYMKMDWNTKSLESNEHYYNKKNVILELETINEKKLLESMKEFAELNNTNKSLKMVGNIYDYLLAKKPIGERKITRKEESIFKRKYK